MTEPFTTSRPAPARRPPSRREVLWNELESLHSQLQLLPPTETYTLEELEAVVTRLRVQLEERVMSERYPDEYWLADFERRLSDGRLLRSEESLALIAELRRVRRVRGELGAALEPLQIQLSQHHDTPRPDQWFYDVPHICDGGPCESTADPLHTAMNRRRRRTIGAVAAVTRIVAVAPAAPCLSR